MKTVVVELMSGKQRIEYREVTLAAAKAILARRMTNRFKWVIPAWQFDETGGTDEGTLQERQREAYRAVAAS